MTKIELSAKEIFVVILRNWLIILICAVVFAALSGVLGERQYRDKIKIQETEYEIVMDEYDKASVVYEKALSDYDLALIELKKERDAVEVYSKRSVLMNIDPNNKQIASISIRIALGNAINTNYLRQLLDHYVTIALQAPLRTLYADFAPNEYDEKFLREVYSVSRGTSDILTITAFGNEYIDAGKCVQVIYDYLVSKQEEVAESTSLPHSISVLGRDNTYIIDNALKTQQAKQMQQLQTLESEIEKIENLNLVMPEAPKAPEVPESPVSAVYSYLTNMPIGIVIGVIIGIVIVLLLYVLRLPIQLPEQIQRQLGIRFLGGIRKNNSALNPAEKMAGNLQMLEGNKAIRLIAANINEVLGNRKKILVTGTISRTVAEEFMKTLRESLEIDNVSFEYAEDINSDADAVVKLSGADAVIIIERLNQSRLRKVNHTRERIQMSGKEILGYLLV